MDSMLARPRKLWRARRFDPQVRCRIHSLRVPNSGREHPFNALTSSFRLAKVLLMIPSLRAIQRNAG